MNGRKDTNDFLIFNDRRNTNELGELDILNLDLNVFTDDILKKKKSISKNEGKKKGNNFFKEDNDVGSLDEKIKFDN